MIDVTGISNNEQANNMLPLVLNNYIINQDLKVSKSKLNTNAVSKANT